MASNDAQQAEIPQEIHQEQVSLLYGNIPSTLIASVASAFVLVIVQWPVIQHTTLILWFTFLCLSLLLRMLIYKRFQKEKPQKNDIQRWENYLFLSSIPSFAFWGAAGIFLFPDNQPMYQAATLLILAGISAGGTNALSVQPKFVYVFLPLLLTPACIMLFLEQSRVATALAIVYLLYAFFLLYNALSNYKSHLTNIRLRIQSKHHEASMYQAKKRMRINEARLMEAEKIAHMGCWEWDIASNDMYWSKEAFHIFETEPKQSRPTMSTFLASIHPKQREQVQAAFQKVIDQQQTCSKEVFQLQTKGLIKTVRCIAKPILDQAGCVVRIMGMVQDISEQAALEEQLLQAQKLESIGVLAGGIAHDFNNMLGSLLGQTYLARKETHGNTQLLTRLENIERISNRAAQVVQHLLVFARKDNTQQQNFDITAFMRETTHLNTAAVPDNIILHHELEGSALHIQGDSTQLQQIIIHLLNNAVHALQEIKKPSIHIRLELFMPDIMFQQQHKVDDTPLAHLSIQDNGCGISKDKIKCIFEPFYTTKGVGEGTGLGLAMVYGAIQSHNGIIEVDSHMGQGTTFHMYLPITHIEQDTMEQSSSLQNLTAYTHQSETILLVDDEEILRLSLEEALQSLGYAVVVAEDGLQAVNTFRQHQENIALVLSDIVMPNMNGHEAAQHIRKMNPNIPYIFMSGYDPSQFSKKADLDNSILIKKPMRIHKLHHHIRQFLDTTETIS